MAPIRSMRRVKNKSPSPIQVTAEQILREAREEEVEALLRSAPPKLKITDLAELDDYRRQKRSQFEDLIGRLGRQNPSVWVRYARWEESQKDFSRARSIWERAVDAHRRDHSLCLKLAEFEMKNGFINHARNVWDRAVTLFPRVDQFWYKYAHMEEMLGNVAAARQIFERWMLWQPDQEAWFSCVNFELRYEETDRARFIFERLLGSSSNPKINAWIRYAKFEMKNGEIGRARNCYERAVEDKLVDDAEVEDLLMAFAKFEELCNEPDRANCIYKFALDRSSKNSSADCQYS